MTILAADHFVRAPDWTWYILGYFFLAGLSGGSYVLAALLRLNGNPGDEAAARIGFSVAFVSFLFCPVLLTLDLGQPLRFWHMLVNTTPGDEGLAFKSWSPMSVGAWGLVIFGGFSFVSFVDALLRRRSGGAGRGPLNGVVGWVWHSLGLLLGLFIAGYTGVLLAVSNQPVWSDTWALGALFLASGLTGSAALLRWLVSRRADARASMRVFERLEHFFPLLELALIVIFVVLLIPPGALKQAFAMPWTVLWVVALAGLVPGLGGLVTPRRTTVEAGPDGAVAVRSARSVAWVSLLVLLGVLALRAAVIFSAQ